MNRSKFNCATKWLGIDKAIGLSLAFTLWNVVSRFTTIFLTIAYLSEEQIGFVYTFGSLVAMQVFFELGLGTVIQQIASLQACQIDPKSGSLTGTPEKVFKLSALYQKSCIAYSVISLLAILFLLPFGYMFFTVNGSDASIWLLPWCISILNVALLAWSTPKILILNASGLIAVVIEKTGFQSIATALTGWMLLICGSGLLSLPIAALLGTVLRIVWLEKRFGDTFNRLSSKVPLEHELNWRQEVFKVHWRVALSWASGYFIFQLLTPVTFSYHGSVAAGQLGLSLSILTFVQNIGYVWISTKLPVFGRLISERQFLELDRLFFKTLSTSLAVVIALCLVFLGVTQLAIMLGIPYSNRLLTIFGLSLLSVTVIFQHVVACVASYLRAFNKEPFLVISIVSAILACFSTMFLCQKYGVNAMLAGHLMITFFVGFVWGLVVFIRKRNEFQHSLNGVSRGDGSFSLLSSSR